MRLYLLKRIKDTYHGYKLTEWVVYEACSGAWLEVKFTFATVLLLLLYDATEAH